MAADHLAFICPRFAEGGTIGGAETLILALAKSAAAAGRKVSLLTTCARNHFTWANEREPGSKEIDGLTVHFFPVNEDRDIDAFLRVQNDIDKGKTISDADQRLWIDNSVNSRELTTHLQQTPYDVILAGPYLFGITYHAAMTCPEKTLLVPCLHDEAFAYLPVISRMFKAVAGFVFNTEPEQELARRLYDLKQPLQQVVGIGLTLPEQPPAPLPALQQKQPYVLYSGRREPLKGTPLLLEYMAVFRQRTEQDVHLVFTGSGDMEIPEELDGHITDLGFVSEQDKLAAMAGAVAFIHPSINESLGIVLLEAWLTETPGLVHAGSDVLRWQCEASNAGFWFRHYPDFEHMLMRLLQEKNLRRTMGRNGRRYVQQRYSWDAVRTRLLQAVDQVAKL